MDVGVGLGVCVGEALFPPLLLPPPPPFVEFVGVGVRVGVEVGVLVAVEVGVAVRVAVGVGEILLAPVTVTMQVAFMLLSAVDVAVIVVIPAPTAITTPFSTVATLESEVDQLTVLLSVVSVGLYATVSVSVFPSSMLV